jgi:hypothetical protein
MAYDPPVVVYDANVLYQFHLQNLLVQCAVDRLVAARWTDEIHGNGPAVGQAAFTAPTRRQADGNRQS